MNNNIYLTAKTGSSTFYYISA